MKPKPRTPKAKAGKKKGFISWPLDEKVQAVHDALTADVYPMLAMHGGGIEIMDIQEDRVYVRYAGACGSCPLAGTGTLDFIEQALQGKVDEGIRVMPV